MWDIITSFGRESLFVNFMLLHTESLFIDVFYRHVIAHLSGGVAITHATRIDAAYLPHFGWLCAYLLLVRTVLEGFGPRVAVAASFFTDSYPGDLAAFKEKFNIVMDFNLVMSLIQIQEFSQILARWGVV
jgi:hypothetical protein